MKKNKQTDIQKYCSLLEEVKWRSNAVEEVVDRNVTHGKEILDYEFCAIQLRKILELIAFSTLIAHKETYSNTFKNFRKHWNAKKLIENLEQIHPDFYPIPIKFNFQDPVTKVKHFDDVQDGYLLKEEVVELYDYCCTIIHTRNPFKTGSNNINIRNTVTGWIQRIKNLLSLHRITLVNSEVIWVVIMESPEDSKVHTLTSMPVD